MNDERARLISTIRQIFGGVVWTHKAHEKDREIYAKRASRDRWINAILISLTTVVLVLSIVLEKDFGTLIGTLFAVASTLFAVYRLSFSPENEAQYHREAAKALLTERNFLLLLIERSMTLDVDLDQMREELQRATDRIAKIYSISPDTSGEAYIKASKALNTDEELTFSTEEIDNLLPPKLRTQSDSE